MSKTTWQTILNEVKLKYHVSSLGREIESLASQNVLRFSLTYMSDKQIYCIADAIKTGAQLLKEFSVYFTYCEPNQWYVKQYSPFSSGSKYFGYLKYLGFKIGSNQLQQPNQFCTDKNEYQTSNNSQSKYETAVFELVKSLKSSFTKMTNLVILGLYNPPDLLFQSECTWPPKLQGLVLGQVQQNLRIKLPNDLLLLALTDTNLTDELSKQVIMYLEANIENFENTQQKLLMKLFGPCARHSTQEEINAFYTQEQLRLFGLRNNSYGLQYLDLSNDDLPRSIVYNICTLLEKDRSLLTVDLSGNKSTLNYTIQRLKFQSHSDMTAEQQISLEDILGNKFTAEDLQKYLMNSLTPNFYRAPASNTVQLLSKFCQVRSEIDDLSELKVSPFVKLMQANKYISNLILDERCGGNLLKFVSLRCHLNRQTLLDIIRKFIDQAIDKKNYGVIETYLNDGSINIRNSLRDIDFDTEGNTCHHGQIPPEARQDDVIEKRAKSAKIEKAKKKKAKQEQQVDYVLQNIRSSAIDSKKSRDSRQTSTVNQDISLRSRTGSTFTTATRATRSIALSATTLKSAKTGGSKLSAATKASKATTAKSKKKAAKSSRSSSALAASEPEAPRPALPPRPKPSSYQPSFMSQQEQPLPKRGDAAPSQSPATSESEDSNEREMRRQYRHLIGSQAASDAPGPGGYLQGSQVGRVEADEDARKAANAPNEKELLDQVIDDVFNCFARHLGGDPRAARQQFAKHEREIMKYCKLLVQDVLNGQLRLEETGRQLELYVDNLLE